MILAARFPTLMPLNWLPESCSVGLWLPLLWQTIHFRAHGQIPHLNVSEGIAKKNCLCLSPSLFLPSSSSLAPYSVIFLLRGELSWCNLSICKIWTGAVTITLFKLYHCFAWVDQTSADNSIFIKEMKNKSWSESNVLFYAALCKFLARHRLLQ